MLRSSLRAVLVHPALVLTASLVLSACGPSIPEDDVARAFRALDEEVHREAPSAEKVEAAYRGALEAAVVEADAYLARDGRPRGEDAAIELALLQADALDLTDVRSHALVSLSLHLRKRLGTVADAFPVPTEPVELLAREWERGMALWTALRPLAEQVDREAKDTTVADIEGALHAGLEAVRKKDAAGVMGAKQQVEKTLLRVLHQQFRAEVDAAFTTATPGEAHFRAQRRALGVLRAVEDRMVGRNSRGLQLALRQLTRSPQGATAEELVHALDVVWAKRTYAYTRPIADEVGTPSGYAHAVEGRTYYKLIAPTLKQKLPQADTAAALKAWDALITAMSSGSLEEAEKAGATLEAQVCEYQRALRISPCTGSADVPATGSTLGASTAAGGVNEALEATLARVPALLAALARGDAPAASEQHAGALKAFFEEADVKLELDGSTPEKAPYAPVIEAGVQAGANEATRRSAAWAARGALLSLFKKESKVALSGPATAAQLAQWDASYLYYQAGWRDLAAEVDTRVQDTAVADIEAAFARGSVGLRDGDLAEAGAARQQVEKTSYRVLFHLVNVRAAEAREQGDAGLQADALGALDLLGDRVSGKAVAADLQAGREQLTGVAPASIDLAKVKRPMLQAFALRTLGYTRHAEVEGTYGVPSAYEKAVEGHTYFRLIARDLLAAHVSHADEVLWRKMWHRWEAAILANHRARGTPTSAFLASDTEGVCAFAKAVGVPACG